MERTIHATETLYHLKNEHDYARTMLTALQGEEYEVSITYAKSIIFEPFDTRHVSVTSSLHDAFKIYRDTYVALLQEGYCYWGLIPNERDELERKLEKKRLLQLTEDYCHPEALHTLTEWRDAQAELNGVQKSAILTNRSLRSLATFLPHNSEELAHCPGIGENKMTLYEPKLISVCSRYQRLFDDPLHSLLPKYKHKNWEEERFFPFRGERVLVQDPVQLREKVLAIGKTGKGVDELARLARVDDRETRRRVASAANKLRLPAVTRSISHLLFDESAQIRQYTLRAVSSSQLAQELAADVRRLLRIEPKQYNRALCRRLLKVGGEKVGR